MSKDRHTLVLLGLAAFAVYACTRPRGGPKQLPAATRDGKPIVVPMPMRRATEPA